MALSAPNISLPQSQGAKPVSVSLDTFLIDSKPDCASFTFWSATRKINDICTQNRGGGSAVSFYSITRLRIPAGSALQNHGRPRGPGTLLLAEEGINGTIAGSRHGIDAVISWLRSDPRFKELETKESSVSEVPFYRTKVKLKKEIVTMGVEGIDPNHVVGTYVDPKDWNALISDPDVLVLDTRNDYEVDIGSFDNAVNPNTRSSGSFLTTSPKTSIRSNTRRSPCSAPAVFAVRNPLPI